MKITKREFIKKYNKCNFKRHILNYKDKDTLYTEIIENLKAQDADISLLSFDADCNCFRYGHNFVRVDKRKQDATGIISFRSKDYIFTVDNSNSYGNIPTKENFTDTGFFINDFDGNRAVEYTIIKEVV